MHQVGPVGKHKANSFFHGMMEKSLVDFSPP
jgi:hypothetical protein